MTLETSKMQVEKQRVVDHESPSKVDRTADTLLCEVILMRSRPIQLGSVDALIGVNAAGTSKAELNEALKESGRIKKLFKKYPILGAAAAGIASGFAAAAAGWSFVSLFPATWGSIALAIGVATIGGPLVGVYVAIKVHRLLNRKPPADPQPTPRKRPPLLGELGTVGHKTKWDGEKT